MNSTNELASWMLLLTVIVPWMGVVVAGFMSLRSAYGSRAVASVVRMTFAAETALAGLLVVLLSGSTDGSSLASIQFVTVWSLHGPGFLSVEWSWLASPFVAGWVSLVNGLAWYSLSAPQQTRESHNSNIPTFAPAIILALTSNCVLSGGLVQMAFFWGAVGLSTWLMLVGNSAAPVSDRSVQHVAGVRWMVLTSLASEGLLWLAVVLMVTHSSSVNTDDIVSARGLATIGKHVPALPGLIGSLIVLGLLGRSGLFPCFDWNAKNDAWPQTCWTMVYLVSWVPLSVWFAWQLSPIVLSSEASRSLLGGLGLLGSLVGSFVASGQKPVRRAISFLLTAQIGVIWVGLADGIIARDASAPWPLVATSISDWDWLRAAIAQSAVIVAFGIVMKSRIDVRSNTAEVLIAQTVHEPSSQSWLEPLKELSRERLHLEHVVHDGVVFPLLSAIEVAEFLEARVFRSFGVGLAIQFPAWLSHQFDSLNIGRLNFELLATVAAALTVLLTLVLVT